MPPGLDIDYKRQLHGSVAAHGEHLLIHTGTADWPSRIEDGAATDAASSSSSSSSSSTGQAGAQGVAWAALIKRALKEEMLAVSAAAAGRRSGGLLVTNSSLACSDITSGSGSGSSDSSAHDTSTPTTIISLLKAGLHLRLPATASSARTLVASILASPPPSPSSSTMTSDTQPSSATQPPTPLTADFPTAPITDLTVLICGHTSRDARCGLLGPPLQHEFAAKLAWRGWDVLAAPISLLASPHAITDPAQAVQGRRERRRTARVGLVSHVGGHAFAGNVILYFPRAEHGLGGEEAHALQGRSVWYGRVRPEHVEGIVDATVRDGLVIEELLRGVV